MKKRWKLTAALILSVVFAAAAGQFIYIQQIQQTIAEKVIRFHVVANSDSETDQQLKLQVRDRIGEFLSDKLKNSDSIQESRQIIVENMDEIQECAQETVRLDGADYDVQAFLGYCRFPEKQYGSVSLPAGRYEALEVVLGEGIGHNWWCVMYPNLCFSGSMYRTDNEKDSKEMKRVLNPEEYKMVMESKDYRIKFRFLTFLNDLSGS